MSDDEYKLSRNSFFLFSCLWVSEMADSSEDGRKKILIEIFEILEPAQFQELVKILKADGLSIDMNNKTPKNISDLTQMIVGHYGEEESFSLIEQAMRPNNYEKVKGLMKLGKNEQRGEFTQSGLVCGGSQLITCS